MFFIPGIVISVLTFPGIIMHELSHQLFCRWFNVPVFHVVYFQMENPNGYVLHERSTSKWQNMMISIGPFILNTLVAILIAMPSSLAVFTYDQENPLNWILLYLAFSISMHAFPSTGDASSIMEDIKQEGTPFWMKLIAYPVVGIIYLFSIGSMFWLDAIYALFLVRYVPEGMYHFL